MIDPLLPGAADGSADLNAVSAASGRHPAAQRWATLVERIEQFMQVQQVRADRTLVLVPYAQLMALGRRAWAQAHPNGFVPRFVSSRHWAAALHAFVPAATDLCLDLAREQLVAAALLERVAPGDVDAALRASLVRRLVEAAHQLAPLAAAVDPQQRLAWAESRRCTLASDALTTAAPLHWENLLAALALTWVSTSAYATDVLWGPLAQPGADADALIVLQGFQPDPLADALCRRWGERACVWSLRVDEATPGVRRLHACSDAEDEAQRASACVLAQLNAGHTPLALVAQDRLLTRRVSALLHSAGVTLQDETGWKLSTTHAGAQLMSLLRAADARAGMDEVLDLLKSARRWPDAQVQTLEQQARASGVSRWSAAVRSPALAAALPEGLTALLAGLRSARPLERWIGDVAAALRDSGLWELLQRDPAGQQVLQALRLDTDAARELGELSQALATVLGAPAGRFAAPLSLAAFTTWVREVLENASFVLRGEIEPAVLVVPLAQLLGRTFAAVVLPACDQTHLSPSPEPGGQWSVAQRAALGLPTRAALAQAAAQAWQEALAQPQLDLLWRTQQRGEAVLPSAWVQALPDFDAGPAAATRSDPRRWRPLQAQLPARPAPAAGDLLPQVISASAYQDLRDCPYRFFALRQLRLSEAAELQDEPDQRDLGNWLHAVLCAFHEQRGAARPGRTADCAALDRHAAASAAAMGLNAADGGGGFLPFEALWPALRDGYLDWLAGFEADAEGRGPRFERAEAAFSVQAESWKLVGKIDRIDRQASPEGDIRFVIDYKTEGRDKTLARVKEPLEDTQLAFYAALLPDENLRAAYLSITDQDGAGARQQATRLLEQTEVLYAREQLRVGLAHDLARVAAGHPMAALGAGRGCDYCSARGLCRKDFWGQA
ncbi:PD-(D/E)XK nuclease family protein [Hydrogenophaga sp.]|uniref:PD-(D/E)XK nuclease family protein n=1 Tax=Hydrogenophaga sp. TaxID=1904254 RepID=UPI0025C0094B|nr:PD-(D/E)XK nuclease family protein [Hydrogenophaga sp.]